MRKIGSVLVLFVIIVSLLTACGGAAVKSLARETVDAIKAKDTERITAAGEKINKLNPIQKAQFAAEMAKYGEDITELLQSELDKASDN